MADGQLTSCGLLELQFHTPQPELQQQLQQSPSAQVTAQQSHLVPSDNQTNTPGLQSLVLLPAPAAQAEAVTLDAQAQMSPKQLSGAALQPGLEQAVLTAAGSQYQHEEKSWGATSPSDDDDDDDNNDKTAESSGVPAEFLAQAASGLAEGAAIIEAQAPLNGPFPEGAIAEAIRRTTKKKSKGGRIASEITREELAQYFNMPSEEAAKRLGVGLTVLKRICRRYGVSRWPYRKLKSLDRLIQNVETGVAPGETYKHLMRSAEDIRERQQAMKEGQISDLDEATKKLQQAYSKFNHKLRKAVTKDLQHCLGTSDSFMSAGRKIDKLTVEKLHELQQVVGLHALAPETLAVLSAHPFLSGEASALAGEGSLGGAFPAALHLQDPLNGAYMNRGPHMAQMVVPMQAPPGGMGPRSFNAGGSQGGMLMYCPPVMKDHSTPSDSIASQQHLGHHAGSHLSQSQQTHLSTPMLEAMQGGMSRPMDSKTTDKAIAPKDPTASAPNTGTTSGDGQAGNVAGPTEAAEPTPQHVSSMPAWPPYPAPGMTSEGDYGQWMKMNRPPSYYPDPSWGPMLPQDGMQNPNMPGMYGGHPIGAAYPASMQPGGGPYQSAHGRAYPGASMMPYHNPYVAGHHGYGQPAMYDPYGHWRPAPSAEQQEGMYGSNKRRRASPPREGQVSHAPEMLMQDTYYGHYSKPHPGDMRAGPYGFPTGTPPTHSGQLAAGYKPMWQQPEYKPTMNGGYQHSMAMPSDAAARAALQLPQSSQPSPYPGMSQQMAIAAPSLSAGQAPAQPQPAPSQGTGGDASMDGGHPPQSSPKLADAPGPGPSGTSEVLPGSSSKADLTHAASPSGAGSGSVGKKRSKQEYPEQTGDGASGRSESTEDPNVEDADEPTQSVAHALLHMASAAVVSAPPTSTPETMTMPPAPLPPHQLSHQPPPSTSTGATTIATTTQPNAFQSYPGPSMGYSAMGMPGSMTAMMVMPHGVPCASTPMYGSAMGGNQYQLPAQSHAEQGGGQGCVSEDEALAKLQLRALQMSWLMKSAKLAPLGSRDLVLPHPPQPPVGPDGISDEEALAHLQLVALSLGYVLRDTQLTHIARPLEGPHSRNGEHGAAASRTIPTPSIAAVQETMAPSSSSPEKALVPPSTSPVPPPSMNLQCIPTAPGVLRMSPSSPTTDSKGSPGDGDESPPSPKWPSSNKRVPSNRQKRKKSQPSVKP